MRDEMFKMTRVQHMPADIEPLFAESSEAGSRGIAAAATRFVGKARNSGHSGRGTGRAVACLVASLLVLLAMVAAPVKASASVSIGVVVSFGPPPLPVYAQPPCPGPGYIWTPGYWAWDPVYGYYWVPGTWVPAPFVGALWTPGYWDYDDDGYRWHPGYWGLAVGFYGGIDYGFGYTGYGYYGGYWDHDRFFYNRAVNNIHNTYITNVYDQRVVVNNITRVSYHGGPGGININPTRDQIAAERFRRSGPINQQIEHERFARSNPVERASFNHGRPEIAATPRPGVFRGNDVIRATRAGGPYRAPVEWTRGNEARRPAPVVREGNGRGFQSFGSPRNGAYYNQRMESRAPRSAPYVQSGNDRGFQSFGSGRNAGPNPRMENRGPAQQRVERPAFNNNSPRVFQQARVQARPQEMRGPAGHAAPERHGPPPRTEEHGGGNGHGHGRP